MDQLETWSGCFRQNKSDQKSIIIPIANRNSTIWQRCSAEVSKTRSRLPIRVNNERLLTHLLMGHHADKWQGEIISSDDSRIMLVRDLTLLWQLHQCFYLYQLWLEDHMTSHIRRFNHLGFTFWRQIIRKWVSHPWRLIRQSLGQEQG